MKHDRIPRLKHWRLAAAGVCLLIGGCGRSLPAIDPELLASKKSVLVLTAASLADNEIKQLQDTAAAQAKERKIAMEFIAKTPSVTPELSSKIKSTAYDSIIAVGNELLPEAAETAKQAPNKRFVLLANGLSRPEWKEAPPPNVRVRGLDDSQKTAVWDEWVKLQKASGLNILWISRTSSPVPAAWAPSEEADRLLQLDVYPEDTWYPQLTYQARALPAHWLALYTPVEEAMLTRMRSLKIPVMDMSASLTAAYDWASILSGSLMQSLGPDWSGGESLYSDQEVAVSRK